MHEQFLQSVIFKEAVEGLVAAARPHERSVIELRARGFKYTEIAQLLGVGPSAARMRMLRARRRILRHRSEAHLFLAGRQVPWKTPPPLKRRANPKGGSTHVGMATDPDYHRKATGNRAPR